MACVEKCLGSISSSCEKASEANSCSACANECNTTSTGTGDAGLSEGGSSGGSEGGTGREGGGGGGGTVSCFEDTGTGSSEVCTSSSTTETGATCTGQQAGSCPSTGLVGCCVLTESSGGVSISAASCIYSSATEADEMTACSGTGGTWQTSAP
jgi:hypothetical protein